MFSIESIQNLCSQTHCVKWYEIREFRKKLRRSTPKLSTSRHVYDKCLLSFERILRSLVAQTNCNLELFIICQGLAIAGNVFEIHLFPEKELQLCNFGTNRMYRSRLFRRHSVLRFHCGGNMLGDVIVEPSIKTANSSMAQPLSAQL